MGYKIYYRTTGSKNFKDYGYKEFANQNAAIIKLNEEKRKYPALKGKGWFFKIVKVQKKKTGTRGLLEPTIKW